MLVSGDHEPNRPGIRHLEPRDSMMEAHKEKEALERASRGTLVVLLQMQVHSLLNKMGNTHMYICIHVPLLCAETEHLISLFPHNDYKHILLHS